MRHYVGCTVKSGKEIYAVREMDLAAIERTLCGVISRWVARHAVVPFEFGLHWYEIESDAPNFVVRRVIT